MNVAEMFVNLGIKGSEKTLGALSSVKSGLGQIKDTSLETKAALIAVMYGLEQMMAKSGAIGTGMTNFAAYTGQSAQALQQWQYAARQAGESSDELLGNVKSVQSAMTKMLMGEAAPKGLGMVARATGGITKEQVKAMAENPFLMLDRLQQYSLKEKNAGLRDEVLKSFGLSEGTISAMARNAFRPDVFKKAPTYSDKELQSLDKSNVAWANLGNQIEMAFGHFNSKHGQELVRDLGTITKAIFKLADALTTLAEKGKVFQALGWAAEKIATMMQLIGYAIDDTSGAHKKKDNEIFGKDSLLKKMLDWRDDMDAKGSAFFNQTKDQVGQGIVAGAQFMPGTSVTTINQHIIHHGDAKDTKAVKETHGTAVNHAFRQRQQGQGS